MSKSIWLLTLLLTFVPGSLAHAYNGGRRWWGMGHMMGYGYWGIFMWVLVLIVIGVAIYLIVQRAGIGSSGSSQVETPLDILKKRYASGEITREQFEEMKKDLGG